MVTVSLLITANVTLVILDLTVTQLRALVAHPTIHWFAGQMVCALALISATVIQIGLESTALLLFVLALMVHHQAFVQIMVIVLHQVIAHVK